MTNQANPTAPLCPACEHPVLLNRTRCPFCTRDFHELCLSSRGCTLPRCWAARRDPPARFYEWRQFGACAAAALALGAIATGALSRPAADSSLLTPVALGAIATTVVIGIVLAKRRRANRSPWTSKLANIASASSALACGALALALLRPIPNVAYDLIAAWMVGSGLVCLVGLLSPFSRTAGLIGLLVLGQSYGIVRLSATPRLDRLGWSLAETYRHARDGAFPPVSYQPTGVVRAEGKTRVLTDGGSFAVGERIPGVGTILGINGSQIRLAAPNGREVALALDTGKSTVAVSGTDEAKPPVAVGGNPEAQLKGLLKDLKDYDRVRQRVESDVLKRRR